MKKWPLDRLVALLLTLAFATLTFDLRYEHNHILRRHVIGWTPIVYSALMVLAGAFALSRWDQGGRRILFWGFSLGLIVGLLGYWQHNEGHLFSNIGVWLSVWAGQHPDPNGQPPIVSPLAFAGLGVVGMVTCADRHRPSSGRTPGPAGP